MEFNEHIAEIIEENRKWDFDELVTAFKEIKAAITVDRASKGKKFPALTTLSAVIRKGEFNRLSPEVWQELADFLEGLHRGKRGIKINSIAREDDGNLYEEIAAYKAKQILSGRSERGLTTEAKELLLKKHNRLDERALDRSLSRHISRKLKAIGEQIDDEKNTPEDFVIPAK